jgi:glycine/D-amino acid oxidase-like deaminating enzyme
MGGVAGASGINAVSPWILPEHPGVDTNVSLWMRFQPPHNRPLRNDLTVDVAIIGGGYTGLSAAYHVARAGEGKRVVVLEARGVGNGASGRNGAMLLPKTAVEYMRFESSPAMHKRIYDLTVESMYDLIALSLSSAVKDSVFPVGALQTFENPEDAERSRDYAEQARQLGMPVQYWDSDQTAAAIGTHYYRGALFEPNAGRVNPMKLVHVQKLAAEAAGAIIYEDSPVIGIEEGREHRIHLAAGPTVKARSLILATNAYTSKLGFFRNAIVPVYNHVAATATLTDAQIASLGWNRRAPFNDSRRLVHYLGLTQDNRIYIGGGNPDYAFNGRVEEHRDADVVRDLRTKLDQLFPTLEPIQFETMWDGLVDMTLDWAPTVGVSGKDHNIYHGLGYCGHGVNLSFLFGRIIADLEGGREAHWSWFPYLNRTPPYIPNEPLRWLGIQGEMAFYRLHD